MIKIDSKELAKRIDVKLDELKIKKSDFFEQSKVSSATLSQWRTGQYDASPKAIEKLEQFFGMPIDEIMGSEKSAKKDTAQKDGADSLVRMTQLWVQLDEQKREKIIGIMEALV